jgi:tetratricopeptide (TPR) repeat protein
MTAWLRSFSLLALVAAALLFAAPAAAQDDAATLFKEGKALYGDGKYQEAYEAYNKAWALQQGFDIAGNLGNVEIELGKYRDAVIHLRYVIANLPPSYDPERREKVLSRTKELLNGALTHVALVTLAIEPDGATVSVDGEDVGTTPLTSELVLAEGKHSLVAKLDGYEPLEHALDAKGGTKETLRMSLKASADAGDGDGDGEEPAPGGEDSADDGPSIPIIIVGAVLGLGAIGAGIGLHVTASGKANDREDLAASLSDQSACSAAAPPPECQEINDLSDEESTFSAAGTALLIVGGALAAATVVYAVWPRGGGDDDDAKEARLMVLPWAGPGVAGVSLGGSF